MNTLYVTVQVLQPSCVVCICIDLGSFFAFMNIKNVTLQFPFIFVRFLAKLACKYNTIMNTLDMTF